MHKSGLPRWISELEDITDATDRFRLTGCCCILAHSEAIPAGLPPSLPAEEKDAPRIGRAGFLLRRRIARALASGIMGRPPEQVAIKAGRGGAAMISGADGAPWISFSSRGPFNLVALASKPVGIDIELDINVAEIPLNLLRPDEKAALDLLSPDARAQSFVSLWAEKEAVAKALHLGFTLAPEAIRLGRGRPFVHLGHDWLALDAHSDVARCEIYPGTFATLALALLSSSEPSAMTKALQPL